MYLITAGWVWCVAPVLAAVQAGRWLCPQPRCCFTSRLGAVCDTMGMRVHGKHLFAPLGNPGLVVETGWDCPYSGEQTGQTGECPVSKPCALASLAKMPR